MKFKNIIKNSTLSLTISIIFLSLFEFFVAFVLGYRTIVKGEKCKLFNKEKNYGFYKPNCKTYYKHWEDNKIIEYKFNEYGRRDELNDFKNENDIKIASVGDSFTLGLHVPIDNNYNYLAFNRPNINKKYLIHNYGVAGENLDNIINKLIDKKQEFLNYDFILYGLTPNDFFYFLEENNSNKNDLNENFHLFRKAKSLLLSTSTSKFFLHNLLKIDETYYSIYLQRKPYSGYLMSDLGPSWINSLSIFEDKVGNLPEELKSKLKIFLLPQRVEVVSYRLGNYNGKFNYELMKSCKKIGIDCSFANLKKLSKLKESHFIVDGHLTDKGNYSIAEDLSSWSEKW